MKDRPHRKIIDQLFILAQDVVPVSKARVVAALVYKNKIVSFGFNQTKTHPMAAKFSKHPEAIKLHAEVDCIRNAINKYGVDFLKKCTLYVVRAKLRNDRETFEYGMAKPCPGCEGAIRKFGIKTAIYTTNTNHIGIGYYDEV